MVLITIFVIFLLCLSAFFSGSETALTATSKSLMIQKESDGDKRAKVVNQLLNNKERLIGTILLGNNLVNILASALTTSLMINFFGEAGVIYATVLMTTLVLIFSEILPKTYALMNSNQIALTVAPIMQPLTTICRPFNIIIQIIVRLFLKIIGVNMQHENFLRENNARHFWHPMAHSAEMLETPPMIISKAEYVEVHNIDG